MHTWILCGACWGVFGELFFTSTSLTPAEIPSFELGIDVVRGAAGPGIYCRWGSGNAGTGTVSSLPRRLVPILSVHY